jgi:hypothetical protein
MLVFWECAFTEDVRKEMSKWYFTKLLMATLTVVRSFNPYLPKEFFQL